MSNSAAELFTSMDGAHPHTHSLLRYRVLAKIPGKPLREHNCHSCILQKSCKGALLFGHDGGSPSAGLIHERLYNRGEYVFHENNPLDAIYIVKSGSIKTHSISEEGNEEVVQFFVGGDVFGTEGLAEARYQCSAVALEKCVLCTISLNKLVHLNSLLFQRWFLSLLSAQTSQTKDALILLGKKRADSRLAAFLLSYYARQSNSVYSFSELRVPMLRSDIGNHIGIAMETVSRLLSQWQKENIIEVDRKAISILDFERLQAISCD